MTGALVAHHWRFGGAEPDLLSWITTACYAGAIGLAAASVVVARRGRRHVAGVDPAEARRQRLLGRVWLLVTVVLLALGVSQLLAAESWMVEQVRRLAWREGWYQRRREVQAQLVAAVVVAGVAGCVIMAIRLRSVARRIAAVLVAVVGLAAFVAIRAISLHDVDHWLGVDGDNGLGERIELGLVVLVGALTLRWLATERRIVADTLARSRAWSGPPSEPLRAKASLG